MRVALHGAEEECRYGGYAESGGELFLFIHVDFVNIYLASILRCKLVEDGCHFPARTAPRSREIDDAGTLAEILPCVGILFEIDYELQELLFRNVPCLRLFVVVVVVVAIVIIFLMVSFLI